MGRPGDLLLDVRGFEPSLRRTVIFRLVDTLLELDCDEGLILVCDHEPAGLGYQIDLRRETRGKYEFTYDQRSDGAWVAMLRRKQFTVGADQTRE